MELRRELEEDRLRTWEIWKDGGTIRGSWPGASCSSAAFSSTRLFCSRFSSGQDCAPSLTGKWTGCFVHNQVARAASSASRRNIVNDLHYRINLSRYLSNILSHISLAFKHFVTRVKKRIISSELLRTCLPAGKGITHK